MDRQLVHALLAGVVLIVVFLQLRSALHAWLALMLLLAQAYAHLVSQVHTLLQPLELAMFAVRVILITQLERAYALTARQEPSQMRDILNVRHAKRVLGRVTDTEVLALPAAGDHMLLLELPNVLHVCLVSLYFLPFSHQ